MRLWGTQAWKSSSQKPISRAPLIFSSIISKLKLPKSLKRMNLQLLSSSGLSALKCLLAGTQDLLMTAYPTWGSQTPSLSGKEDSKKIMEGYLFATKARAEALGHLFSTGSSLMSAQATRWRNACKTKLKHWNKKKYLFNSGLSKFSRRLMNKSECSRRNYRRKKGNTWRKNRVLMRWKPCWKNRCNPI